MFQVSRRDLVVGAAGACAAFGLSKPIAFIDVAMAQQIPSGPGFRKYKVGDIEVFSLYDGVWEKAHDEGLIKGANVEETKTALKASGLSLSDLRSSPKTSFSRRRGRFCKGAASKTITQARNVCR